jgi:arylsulfatase A-like enzyme
MTGKHLPGHGVYRLYDVLPENEVLFPEHLRQAGYRTALFGKLHVSGRIAEAGGRHPNDGFETYEWCMEPSIELDSPLNAYSRWLKERYPECLDKLRRLGRGFKHVPRECHMTRWAAERTIDFIRSSGDDPFFCMMSVFDPHNPYDDFPEEMGKAIDPSRLPRLLPQDEERGGIPSEIERERKHSYLGDAAGITIQATDEMRRGYYASVALIDLEVGRVLAQLEASGKTDNTLVIFVSDHGDMLGDHGLYVKGAYFYEACTKVPLILRWPKGFQGMRTRHLSALVQPHDLAATILRAAGISEELVSARMPESRDLTGLIRGETDSVHPYVVCAYRNSGISDSGDYWTPPIHATMIRTDTHKMSYFHRDGDGQGSSDETPPGQLFDMNTDPHERQNLWNDLDAETERTRHLSLLIDWEAAQERQHGSRGGDARPSAEQRLDNKQSRRQS